MALTSDVKKFRVALDAAGFTFTNSFGGRTYLPTIFNDKRKGARRLKLWNGSEVNSAPTNKKSNSSVS